MTRLPSFQFGRFNVALPVFGTFRLDGGAMFGSVPRALWSKRISPDSDHCIQLCTRSLLLRFDGHTVLVDVGMGEKWNERSREIFAIRNFPRSTLGFDDNEITDVVLTHLHFDHAGGVSHHRNGDPSKLELTYPQARHFIQADNLATAKNPSLKERASYLRENVEVIEKGKITLLHGSTEIFTDFWVHQVNGHTSGQQFIELRSADRSLLFPTDLIPTAHHVPLPFTMGYDMCAATLLEEKERFLDRAIERNAFVVFEHDVKTAIAVVGKDERGSFCVEQGFDSTEALVKAFPALQITTNAPGEGITSR